MDIKYFLVFIGSLLLFSIVLAIATKNLAEGIAVGGKKPFLYGYGLAILTSLAGYLASYISENPFEVFWWLGGIFFLFGIMHMLFIHNRFFYANKYNSNKVLIAEILFGLSVIFFTIVIFSALQYFIKKDQDFLFYPVVMSALLFLVPLLIFHSFQAAYSIPPAIFPTWKYPMHKPVEIPDIDEGDRILIIGFEVAEKATDNNKYYFRVRAVETWPLSTLFYHFLNEYNDPDKKTAVEYIDKEDDPYEWWFYRKPKWYQMRKILNPEFSIRESSIKENTIIVCERLLDTTPVARNIQKQLS